VSLPWVESNFSHRLFYYFPFQTSNPSLEWVRIHFNIVSPFVGLGTRLSSFVLLLGKIRNQISELPPEMKQMRSLKELYLAANFLTDLPESLCEMKGKQLDRPGISFSVIFISHV